jgi:hypothetical protein
LIRHHFVEMETGGTAMNGQSTNSVETIDRKTSRSIIEAVGERLQQSLRPETSRLSPRLENLMDELRRRDSGERRGAPNQRTGEIEINCRCRERQ